MLFSLWFHLFILFGAISGSKLGKEYIKDVYCHPAYLTYMWSTSCEMQGWMNQKLEPRLLYCCGQESLRRNGVAIMVNKRVQNAVLGSNLKNDRMISVHFQGTPFNITVTQAYVPTSNAEEAEVEWFYEDLQRPFRTNTQKRCPFHYRGLECKSRKSRNTWSNRQIWSWNTE